MHSNRSVDTEFDDGGYVEHNKFKSMVPVPLERFINHFSDHSHSPPTESHQTRAHVDRSEFDTRLALTSKPPEISTRTVNFEHTGDVAQPSRWSRSQSFESVNSHESHYGNKSPTDERKVLRKDSQYHSGGIDRSLAYRQPNKRELSNDILVVYDQLRRLTRRLIEKEEQNMKLEEKIENLRRRLQVRLSTMSISMFVAYFCY